MSAYWGIYLNIFWNARWQLLLMFLAFFVIFYGICILYTFISHKKPKFIDVFKYMLLAAAATLVVFMTVSGREPIVNGMNFKLEPFWSYKDVWRYLISTPNANVFCSDTFMQILGNVLIYVPLGVALPLCFNGLQKFWATLLFAFAVSLAIELFQGFTGAGLGEFDDVFNNTLGAAVGYTVHAALSRLYIAIKTKVKIHDKRGKHYDEGQ